MYHYEIMLKKLCQTNYVSFFLAAHEILQEQTPRKLMEVRSRIYELLTHCIPPDVIFV